MERTVKVLLVDDEPVVIDAMASYLADSYHVLVAADGKKAIEIAKNQVPDIIVMDIAMPVMDGLEAGNILKNDPLTQEIPIIYSTAHSQSDSVIEALRIGAVDFLHKPVVKEILLSRVQKQVQLIELHQENLKKDKLIVQQSKLAAMGEMIGNIAHQWRQPLSVITTSVSNIQVSSELETLSDEELHKWLEQINTQAVYLSDTIDVFRDFVHDNKAIVEVVIQERIDASLSIVDATYKSNHINVIKEIDYGEDIYVHTVQGEIVHVLVNILNNAKDALRSNCIEDPWVKISLREFDNEIAIDVEDNAGGIPEDILEKIFEPYYTTKFKNRGTGLGLYMSKQIIETSMDGSLEVVNTKNGAKFTISLSK